MPLLKSNSRAFTLIELLIVITIIGVLSVALIPRLTGGPAKARDAQRKASMQQIATALELYADDHQGAYPTQPGNASCFHNPVLSIGIVDDVTPYMTSVPTEPSDKSWLNACPGGDFVYFQTLDGYILVTSLESTKTKADNTYRESGTPGQRFNPYAVSNPPKNASTQATIDANAGKLCSVALSDCAKNGAAYILYR